MLIDDVILGKVYGMVENEGSLIKRGAHVKVLNIVEGTTLLRVQDLSPDKFLGGKWLVPATSLVELSEEEIPFASGRSTMATPVPLPEKDILRKSYYDAHYQSQHQPIEVMQANMSQEELIGFLKGNIIKYACRCGKKDDAVKEATKIKRYAGWLLDVLEGKTIDPRK